MNKKFYTLVAGLLLAGGVFSANAQTEQKDLAKAGDFYYVLKVHDSETTVPYGQSYSVEIENKKLQAETNFTEVAESNVWKVAKVTLNNTTAYTFTNAEGAKLQFDKDGIFTTDASKVVYNAFTLNKGILQATSKLQLTQEGNTYKLTAKGTPTKLYTLPAEKLDTKVNDQLGDGFSITIGKTKTVNGNQLVWDGAYDLKGNVFTGKLTLGNDGTLKREDGKYIVLTKATWGTISNSLQAEDNKSGYKFDARTEKGGDDVLASTFTITQPNALSDEPLEIVAGTNYELMVAVVDGVAYLTTGDAKASEADQRVGKASYTSYTATTAAQNTYVKFGADNYADYAVFNDAVWNIYRTDAKGTTLVAGPAKSSWVPDAQVAVAYPEGQWLWNGTTFTNRESGATLELNGLRKSGKELVYTLGDYSYTFVKAGVPGDVQLGYLNGYSDDQLLKEAFYIGTPIKATNDTVYVAKDEKGALYLTKDVATAVEFRLAKENFQNDAKTATSDVIKHFTQYASSDAKNPSKTDTLNLAKYFVTEAATGEKLAFDNVSKKFILSEDAKQYQSLVFKNKGEAIYNLVQDLKLGTNDLVDKDNKYVGEEYKFFNANKIYGAHNTAALTQAEDAYNYVANDLFILKSVEAGQYVSGIAGDTIKIFRNADNNYTLYEKGEFLGLENFLDPTYSSKHAALAVEGAAGLDTWRPEYLLGVGLQAVTDGWTCPYNPEHNTAEWRAENGGHCADAVQDRPYVTGRYLVNLVDSAKALDKAGVKPAANKYIYQNYNGHEYYKLGFVPAIHVGDTLIIVSTNDTINLTSNDFAAAKVCNFAFHYTDGDRKAFTIETTYDGPIKGYVKYHNGVPVVSNNASDAEVFVLEQTSENPTANEGVNAEAGVSVVAVDGAIIVKNAAGKKVAISNILGKAIANTTIASDYETIAAPAGIAVVAVEGEEAVKVVVK